MFLVLLLGFSCGIPLALTGSTLQAWMTDSRIDLKTIGIFSLVGLPYTLKFVWSPVMDRFIPPLLGRRRGWMLLAQLALVAAIAAMPVFDPAANPAWTAAIAVVVAFFSASQDIAVDAWRTEVLTPEERGAGAAIYIMGYRIAMLLSGAGALILADHVPWRTVYPAMATAMGIGVLASFLASEAPGQSHVPRTLTEAVIHPFLEYFRRRGAFEMLAFVILYKLGDVAMGSMTTPFMMQLGFTKTDIGAVTKGFGMVSTVLGGLAGGAILMKIGLRRSLWIFGILQAVSNLAFVALAEAGKDYAFMVSAIAIENLSGGMGTAAFAAFLMSICNRSFTATQYALLTSLMAISRVFVGAPTGYLAEGLGWSGYFVACTALALPGLAMLTRFPRWEERAGGG